MNKIPCKAVLHAIQVASNISSRALDVVERRGERGRRAGTGRQVRGGSGTVGLEEFIDLTTALVTEADLDRTNGNFDALFAKFDHGGDGYVDLAKLRFVCRELGEQLGSGSEQADDQLREMLKHASKDGSGERVTKDELYDCLAKTRLM